MATVIANHRVSDYNAWKPGYLADLARRASAGITDIAVGESADDPGMAYMIWDVKDVSVLEPMFTDPALQQMLKEAGVISQPEMMILE